MYETLNDEQRCAADTIINALQASENDRRCFFVDGPGGCGEAYLYRTLNSIFRGMGKTVVNIAWSGIAAQLLFKGRTAHNVFKLPVPTNKENFMPNIHPTSKQANYLRNTDIIWDEAPMSPKYAIEGVDELLRDICRNDVPFGGKLVLFGGDFRQVPPVTKEGHNSAILEFSLKRSKLWKILTKIQLTTNMRAKGENTQFLEFLLRVGNGTEETNNEGQIKIPERIRSEGDLIHEIFGDDINSLTAKDVLDSAILCSTNEECHSYNESILGMVNGEVKTYFSIDDATVDGEQSPYPTKSINSLTPPGLPPHELKLKEGACV